MNRETDKARPFHMRHDEAESLEHSTTKDATRLAQVKRSRVLTEEAPAPVWLNRKMSDLLARATLLATGGVANVNPSVMKVAQIAGFRTRGSQAASPPKHTQGADSAIPYTGPILDPALYWRRYDAARMNGARLEVVADLQRAITRYSYGPRDASLVPNTREWKERIAADSRSSRTVAELFGISHTEVLRLRRVFA